MEEFYASWQPRNATRQDVETTYADTHVNLLTEL